MTNGTDYRAILASDTPLIDVRAPVEFSQSAMPAAINLPLMNDEERAAVGTCYKRQGPEAALALGHKLVQGDLRASRTQAWLEACARYPHGYLCCARGGQRSHIVQQWLKEAGVDYPLIVGGYKALRQAAIQATDELVQRPIVLIGGCTGNGKTQLVCSRPDGIDWKGLLITAVLHSVEPCRISIRRPPLKTTWRSACLKKPNSRPAGCWKMKAI